MEKVITRRKGRRGIPDETREKVVSLYNADKMGCKDIALVCGISEASVFRIMRERRTIGGGED